MLRKTFCNFPPFPVSDNDSTIPYHLQDCLTDGHKRPKCDESQDWHVTNLTENDGMTTMEFYRLRNTNDAEGDNVIDVSCTFFLENLDEPLKAIITEAKGIAGK